MDEQPQILHLITRSDWGGASRVVKLLSTMTDARVTVACGPGGRLIDELEAEGIRVYELPNLERAPHPLNDLRALRSIYKLLRAESFDLVHCHSTKAGLLGRIVANWTNTPSIFTVHGWGFYNVEYDWLSPLIIQGERLLAKRTDAFVCVSQNDLREGKKSDIVEGTKTFVVHNGVPSLTPSETRTTVSDLCDIDRDVPVLGAIARLAPQKNPLAILKTAKDLRDSGYEVETVLVGDGPLMEKCKNYIQRHELDRVHLLGFQETALDLLFDFDVFLLPSRFEGFPLTVLESLHAGVPLVAYEVGGVPEAIDHGKTGFLVSKDDHKEFVESVERLLEDDERRLAMSECARSTARNDFSAERMVEEYERVYHTVLNE